MIERLNRDRRVVPRWHGPEASARRMEAQGIPSLRAGVAAPVIEASFEYLVHDWNEHRHVVFATDLVGAALPFGDVPEAREAAEFILADPNASTLARSLAQRYLNKGDDAAQLALPIEGTPVRSHISAQIRQLRARTRVDPRNAMVWVELARQYVLRGQKESAKRAMQVALALAPDERFVLRAAVRLWVHAGEPDQAHRLLLRSRRTRSDPWLISAEIAAASLAGHNPRLVKQGRDYMRGVSDPRHTTELASSLATLALEAGEDKRARRLFNASLQAPNDNALAQAEWASPRVHLVGLEKQFELVPDSWEARALDAAADGEVDLAVEQAFLWLADQPYSTDASVFGSYQASKARRFSDGVRFAEIGLIANPGEPTLLNNMAFCLAKLDRIQEARDVLAKIPRTAERTDRFTTHLATEGLIEFRAGNIQQGLDLYCEAIGNLRDPVRKVIAFVLMTVELLRANAIDDEADQLIRVVADRADKSDPEARYWLTHLGDVSLRKSPPRIPQQSLDARTVVLPRAVVRSLLDDGPGVRTNGPSELPSGS